MLKYPHELSKSEKEQFKLDFIAELEQSGWVFTEEQKKRLGVDFFCNLLQDNHLHPEGEKHLPRTIGMRKN